MYFWTDKTIPAPAPELLLANILPDKVEVGSLLACNSEAYASKSERRNACSRVVECFT